ncbi:MAG TPA: hypothetical protein VGG06_32100 [Thermoanaerobaculia bacterium]|jgi:hypothetical protein
MKTVKVVAAALSILLAQMLGCTERPGTTEGSIAGENAKPIYSDDSISEPETCLKLVFNEYCLGGSSVSLPPGGVNQGDGANGDAGGQKGSSWQAL